MGLDKRPAFIETRSNVPIATATLLNPPGGAEVARVGNQASRDLSRENLVARGKQQPGVSAPARSKGGSERAQPEGVEFGGKRKRVRLAQPRLLAVLAAATPSTCASLRNAARSGRVGAGITAAAGRRYVLISASLCGCLDLDEDDDACCPLALFGWFAEYRQLAHALNALKRGPRCDGGNSVPPGLCNRDLQGTWIGHRGNTTRP